MEKFVCLQDEHLGTNKRSKVKGTKQTQETAHEMQDLLQSKDPLCTAHADFWTFTLSRSIVRSTIGSHFSLQTSYLFQLLFTEFIFSLLGLQETVQLFFLLGLNMLLKLLFFVGHHFSLQQIQQQISSSPNGLWLTLHFSPKTQNSGYSHHDTHHNE